jgi:hypothetical protein
VALLEASALMAVEKKRAAELSQRPAPAPNEPRKLHYNPNCGSWVSSAIREVMLGQADNLGGGVFKKRLGRNLYRSLILAKGGRYWVYAYLFAKKDRANIDDEELTAFRALADLYARKTDADIARELQFGELVEIDYDEEPQI